MTIDPCQIFMLDSRMLTLVLKGVLIRNWFTIINTMMVLLRIGLRS